MLIKLILTKKKEFQTERKILRTLKGMQMSLNSRNSFKMWIAQIIYILQIDMDIISNDG